MPFCCEHKWNDHLWSGKPADNCQLKKFLSVDEEDRRKYLSQQAEKPDKKKDLLPNCPHPADYPNQLCESCSLMLDRCERCGKKLLPGQPRNPSRPPLEPEEDSPE